MLCGEIIAVCSQIHTKHINTLCGRNMELLNVKPDGKPRHQDVLPNGNFCRLSQLESSECSLADYKSSVADLLYFIYRSPLL